MGTVSRCIPGSQVPKGIMGVTSRGRCAGPPEFFSGALLLAQGKLEMTNLDMKLGTTLKLKGRIADDADGFSINLGQATDKLGLHFNPRFKESTIVCNSRDGNWGREQRDSHLCFSPGSEIKVTVDFHSDGFKVQLPDGYQLTFPNRMGYSHLSYLSVQGGLLVSSLKFN